MSESRVFTRRSVISLVAVGAISFGAAVYLALDGGSGHVALTPVAASFSKSAIGHHAFFEVLERAGVPVRIERVGTAGTAGGAGEVDGAREADLALVLEPQPGRFNPYALDAALSARAVLLVLPKWHGTSSSTAHPGWLGSVALHPIRKVDAIVQRAESEANMYRRHETQRFTDGRFGARPEIDRVQVLRGGTIRPIVASERGGILVGELHHGEHRLWIVSDPDLLNNHGISRGDNAVLAVSLVEALLPPGGTVVVDEALHRAAGIVRIRPPSVRRALFNPPFVIITIQVAAAVAVLLLAAVGRFGSPRPAPRPLPSGHTALLDNMARLAATTSHGPLILRRYHDLVKQEALRRLHVPPRADDDTLTAWLDQTGDLRGVERRYSLVRANADAAAAAARTGRTRTSAIVAAGRELFRWKGEITDGR